MGYWLLLLALASAPVLAILYWVDRLDFHKEPRKALLWVFVQGIVMVVPAVILGLLLEGGYAELGFPLEGWAYIFLSSFITAALIEESMKYWVLARSVRLHETFDEVVDGVVYGVFVSLGFAFIENILYVMDGGVETALLRACLSIPGHALFGGWMGYYVGKAQLLGDHHLANSLRLRGLGIAIVLHGVYNFLLFTESLFALLVIPLLYFGIKRLLWRLEQHRHEVQVRRFSWRQLFVRLWGFLVFLSAAFFGVGLLGALFAGTLALDGIWLFLAGMTLGVGWWGVYWLRYRDSSGK